MKYYCYLLLILSALLTGCCGQWTNRSDITLTWRMGENMTDKPLYTNTFVIHNNSEHALNDEWTIYYNQLSRDVILDSLSPVSIEYVNADYFRMKPTKYYKTIQPGDSLVVDFVATNGLIIESHAPLGAFIVTSINGVEQQPLAVPINTTPLKGYAQLNRPWADEPPYAYGEWLFKKNDRIKPAKLDQSDVFPSVKSVKEGVGSVRFNSFVVDAPSHLANEKEILSEGLINDNKISNGGSSAMKITLRLMNGNETIDNEELYRLAINIDGITIEGATSHGVFNGTQTLLQMIAGQSKNITLDCMNIEDYPDMRYRGQMLDVARNFTKKEDLKKLIDVFSRFKLNNLHLHLTDDEGWRIEIPGIEELTQVGARRGYTLTENECLYPAYGSGYSYTDPKGSGNGYYSRKDMMEILQYAAKRHMKVICEIDFPSHARAAIKAMEVRYRKYIATDSVKANQYLLTDFADTSCYISAQCYKDNVVCAAKESTYEFIDKVAGEIASMYKDAGLKAETIHIGGDEVPRGAWSGSESCHKLVKKEGLTSVSDLRVYFFDRASQIFERHGITVSGWQELALNSDETVNSKFLGRAQNIYCWNTVSEWGGDVIPYKLANAGYEVVLSNVTNFYFDLCYMKHRSERGLFWGGFNDEVSSFNMQPYNIYRSNRTNLRGENTDIFSSGVNKPQLKDSAKQNILGVQGQLFLENQTTFDHQCYALFPKMFGMMERGWNAYPDFSLENDPSKELQLYSNALSRYYAKIFDNALPYIKSRGLDFRVNPPGATVQNGVLIVNNPNPKAEIRYTTDGSEPTLQSELWTNPVKVNEQDCIQLKAFYLGKESCTIDMAENNEK